MSHPEQDPNLRIFLSVILSRYAEIYECVDSLKMSFGDSASIEKLEKIERSLKVTHTLYSMVMQHILNGNQKYIDEINALIGRNRRGD